MEGMEENKGVPLYAYPLIGFLLVVTVVVIVVLFVRRCVALSLSFDFNQILVVINDIQSMCYNFRNLQKKHKVLSPYLDKEMKMTTLLTEDAPVYANNGKLKYFDFPRFTNQ